MKNRVSQRVVTMPTAVVLGMGWLLVSAAPVRSQVQTEVTPSSRTSSGTQTAYATDAQVVTDSRIVLNLQQRRVYLYKSDMLVSSYPVAVGTAETPTPRGEFSVSQMIENPVWQSPWTGEVHQPGPDSALGLRWIEFATSDKGAFGFHGTPTLDSIGTAASNGCVRMRNEDVVALFSQVGVGTSVTIQ